MAVTLTGSNGLFTRLGKLFQIAVQVKSFQNTLATEIQDALDEFDGGDNDQAIAITNIKTSAQKSCAAVYGAVRAAAHKAVIEMVHDDDPLPAKTVDLALDRLIRQMEDSSASINASAYSVSTSADGANTGNGSIISTIDANTKAVANTRAESLVFKCIRDAQTSGTAGREVFEVVGEQQIGSIADYDWPGGSGASSRVVVTDPQENASSQFNKNLLTNSTFENFTANSPDNWTIAVGAAGTQISKNTTAAKIYQGTANLIITGDSGGTLTKITQSLNTSGQTTGKLQPDTVYGLHFKVYLDSGISAGVLKVSVKDSGGTSITSDSMTAEATANLGALAAGSWQSTTAFFKTPKALPSGTPYTATVELTTALTNTKNCYVDQLCVFKATQVASGPYVAVLRGATDYVRDDEFVMTVTKSSTGTFQEYMDKFFDMYARGKQLPEHSGGSETIADSLIA